MARSKTLTKTIAVRPDVHEKLLELQVAYKLRTINDTIERLISQLGAEHNIAG
jgi:predicted CopG family antitoxin